MYFSKGEKHLSSGPTQVFAEMRMFYYLTVIGKLEKLIHWKDIPLF